MNVLPIRARNYTVSSCPSENSPNDPIKVALCVDIYPPRYDPHADIKSDVLKDLNYRGFNPNSFEIIWKVITPTT
jgi:hypothetical protein